MNWFDCLHTFLEVAECQSFIGAARTLGATNSVVTKRIQWLESQLACSLLIRTTRKVTLTDAGEHLLKRITPLLNEWQDIHAQLIDFKSQPQGELTVCMPPLALGQPDFVSVFTQFLQAYPNMRLHLTPTHEPLSLVDNHIDVLISTSKYILEPATTIGVRLCDFEYQCYAAPSYIEKYGRPHPYNDLHDHNCILYRNENQWEFSEKTVAVSGNLRSDTGIASMNACIQGAGLIYIPSFLAKREVKQGLLKPLLTKKQTITPRLMMFYTQHEYTPQKIRLFIDFMREHLKL